MRTRRDLKTALANFPAIFNTPNTGFQEIEPMSHVEANLATVYGNRFEGLEDYRNRVWRVLIEDYFQSFINPGAAVLDLGCGYGEFINNIRCGEKLGMDLNPNTARILGPDVRFLQQDCSTPWSLPNESLDVVFTSNFFEHLPDKAALGRTLDQAERCLRPGGILIAMGPNIKCLPGLYWDFWDHYLPLTDVSLCEGLNVHGFEVVKRIERFLPYSMVGRARYPMVFLRAYLKIPLAWRFWGRQFLLVGRKPFCGDKA
jgi:SAM-dependent methyltransferase